MSPMNLHFGDSGWKRWEAIKTQGAGEVSGALDAHIPRRAPGSNPGLGESE